MFSINDRLKINDQLCQVDKREERKFQFGSLNYLVIMLDWEFEVERLFTDDFHGEMAECRVIDTDNIRSNVVVKLADMVLSQKTAIKMDFIIDSKFNKYQPEIDAIKLSETLLLSARTKLKKSGVTATERSMLDNWNEIKVVRAKLLKLETKTEVLLRIKHVTGFYDLDCKNDEEIPRKLRQAIRQKRSERAKIKSVSKTISSGFTLDKVGGVLVKSGRFLEINEKFALNIIKEPKVPNSDSNYVGIEIEMLSPKNIENMNKEFIKARLHRYVNVGTDASIRSDLSNVNPMELRICLPQELLAVKLKEICEVLRKNDCYANRSCGMHVHIDMRNRNPELCYKNFFKVQKIMLNAQPLSRRDNEYCRPNIISKVKLDEFSQGDRRRVINTHSYSKNNMKTIEIRVHEGATKYKDIFNWVNFLVATASLTEELPNVINTTSELRSANFLSESVLANLESRIEEYSA